MPASYITRYAIRTRRHRHTHTHKVVGGVARVVPFQAKPTRQYVYEININNLATSKGIERSEKKN